MAQDAAGDVYATDTANNEVLKLAAGTSAPRVLPFPGLEDPGGVAVNAAGDVYVTDEGNKRVLKLAARARIPGVLPFSASTTPAR